MFLVFDLQNGMFELFIDFGGECKYIPTFLWNIKLFTRLFVSKREIPFISKRDSDGDIPISVVQSILMKGDQRISVLVIIEESHIVRAVKICTQINDNLLERGAEESIIKHVLCSIELLGWFLGDMFPVKCHLTLIVIIHFELTTLQFGHQLVLQYLEETL